MCVSWLNFHACSHFVFCQNAMLLQQGPIQKSLLYNVGLFASACMYNAYTRTYTEQIHVMMSNKVGQNMILYIFICQMVHNHDNNIYNVSRLWWAFHWHYLEDSTIHTSLGGKNTHAFHSNIKTMCMTVASRRARDAMTVMAAEQKRIHFHVIMDVFYTRAVASCFVRYVRRVSTYEMDML